MDDALAILRNTTPERCVRFAELYMVDLDAAKAAAQVGAPGQERALMGDRRTLTYISALCGQMREVHAELRAHMVGMLSHMALYDPKGAIKSGMWLPFDEWPDTLRMCVEAITFHESGSIKSVKFTRRLDVIHMLLQLTGDVSATIKSKNTRVVFEPVVE